jgi:hypothetical protein
MKSFRSFILSEQALSDDKHVHRIDETKISDFSSEMNTYQHNSDWTESGILKQGETPEKGWKTSIGVFAADSHNVAPYAAPRNVKWISYDENDKWQLIFDKKDEKKIEENRYVISSFPKERFKYIKTSGEYFSENPGVPVVQNTIKNAVKFMQTHGYNVQFVPDINKHKKELEKNNVEHNAEGF